MFWHSIAKLFLYPVAIWFFILFLLGFFFYFASGLSVTYLFAVIWPLFWLTMILDCDLDLSVELSFIKICLLFQKCITQLATAIPRASLICLQQSSHTNLVLHTQIIWWTSPMFLIFCGWRCIIQKGGGLQPYWGSNQIMVKYLYPLLLFPSKSPLQTGPLNWTFAVPAILSALVKVTRGRLPLAHHGATMNTWWYPVGFLVLKCQWSMMSSVTFWGHVTSLTLMTSCPV